MKRVLFATASLLLVLTAACAPAVPTIDAAQVQASAMAAAVTMIAQTQAAMPTPTAVPPTPIPSPTPLPSPTLGSPTAAPPTVAPTNDPESCDMLLDLAEAGAPGNLKVNNLTRGSVTLTIGLSSKNAFGQCGYMSTIIKPKESVWMHPPLTGKGPCYWSYAWVNDPKNPSLPAGAPALCMNSTDKYELDIDYHTMRITPP